MSLIIDVDFNEFKHFIRDDGAFFWTETDQAFILIKPQSVMIVRTVVLKTDQERDNAFKLRELFSYTAKYVLGFTVDGVPMQTPAGEVPPTEAVVNLEEKEEIEYANSDNKQS